MIYLFTGNSDYLIQEEIKRWKQRFLEKFSEHNIFHIKDISQMSLSYCTEIFLSSGLFVEKKLIILEGYPGNSESKKTGEELDTFFTGNFSKFPEENIIVFVAPEVDRRSKVYKEIKLYAQEKEFSITDDSEIFSYISQKYPQKITRPALELLVRYKAGNIGKIIQEIEKLLILHQNITPEHIENFVSPELEESMFLLVDALFHKRYGDFLKMTQNLLQDMNEYAFLMTLLGNLRNFGYIHHLKQEKIPVTVLPLGNKAFLATKNFKMSSQEISGVYLRFLALDMKLKKGNFIGSEQEDFVYELEKVLCEYI